MYTGEGGVTDTRTSRSQNKKPPGKLFSSCRAHEKKQQRLLANTHTWATVTAAPCAPCRENPHDLCLGAHPRIYQPAGAVLSQHRTVVSAGPHRNPTLLYRAVFNARGFSAMSPVRTNAYFSNLRAPRGFPRRQRRGTLAHPRRFRNLPRGASARTLPRGSAAGQGGGREKK